MIRAACVMPFVVACTDPLWKAEGVVVDTSGNPVAHAAIVVVCSPNGTHEVEEVLTTETGRFEVGGRDARAMGCSLEVSKPGKHLKTVHMMEVCFRSKKTRNYELLCGASEGKITLE